MVNTSRILLLSFTALSSRTISYSFAFLPQAVNRKASLSFLQEYFGAAVSSSRRITRRMVEAPTPQRTFYRRQLPDTCTAFSSPQGRAMFASALQHKGLRSFFHVMEQYTTQSEPAYCGLSTLVMALNALAVDPLETWKGPWRWYEERMLNCCVDLEQVKQTGIPLAVFHCLALCQGLQTKLQYADETSIADFRQAVQDACVEEDEVNDNATGSARASSMDRILVVSYNRKVLQQTGSGHFSPLAAYDVVSDSVLILDTARFKYGAHWVPLPLLFSAMQPIDPDTGRSRGHVTLIHHQAEGARSPSDTNILPKPLLLRAEMRQFPALRDFKTAVLGNANGSISYSDVVRYCTRDGLNPNSVWELTQPQRILPSSEEDPLQLLQLIDDVRDLIRTLYPVDAAPTSYTSASSGCNSTTNVTCRPDRCRTVPLVPSEAMVILFLACLDDRGAALVAAAAAAAAPERAKEQLIAEATLLRYAIDSSSEQYVV